jgi:hypothetical protein
MRVVGGSRAFLAARLREAHARLPPTKTQRPDLPYVSSIQHLGLPFMIPLLYSLCGKNTAKKTVAVATGEVGFATASATVYFAHWDSKNTYIQPVNDNFVYCLCW